MKIRAAFSAILAVLVTAAPAGFASAQSQCPTGSFPSVDSWGNRICKRFGSGDTATVQTRRNQCPTGSYSTVDSWGNRVCRTFNSPNQPKRDYYDTSKGCPTGSFPSVDSWGNKVCKRF